jgi:rhodanese-related sulfurtransferase
MPSSVREMLAEANAAVPRLNPAEVRDMIGKGNVLIVDVRDAPELAAGGKLKGAVNASRGTLEFRADPDSPAHHAAFQRDKTVLVYCGSGGRAALSGKTLKGIVDLSRRGMLFVSVARQLGSGNSFVRLLCCPLPSQAGRKKASSVR